MGHRRAGLARKDWDLSQSLMDAEIQESKRLKKGGKLRKGEVGTVLERQEGHEDGR